jgi:hypothetical protein
MLLLHATPRTPMGLFAAAVKRKTTIVSHASRKMSAACTLFLAKQRTISCPNSCPICCPRCFLANYWSQLINFGEIKFGDLV